MNEPTSSGSAPRGRLNELTAIRGLAALMVVLFHARGSWHPIFESGEHFSMLVATGWMWVHFFFVLSGFVMMEAYGADFAARVGRRAYWRFIVTRFGRIYPLHFFTLCAMAMLLVFGAIEVTAADGSFISSLLLTQGFTYVPLVWNGPAWSISTEWYTYLIFPFLVPLAMRVPPRATRIVWIVIACAVVYFFTRSGDGDDWPLGRLVLCVIEFALGCATHRLVVERAWPLVRRPAVATAICVAPIVLMALPKAFDSTGLHAVVAVGFALAIGIVAAEKTLVDDVLNSRLLQFLGLISYSVYLNHEILYSLARSAADAWTGRAHALHDLPSAWGLALFPLYVATLIAVSWATWRWIEEPLRAWFKNRARGGRRVDRLVSADRP
jgi:peptidoglycan/LPS O-acetylase OafA/YrhL